MRSLTAKALTAAVLLLALSTAGCYIISGTFVIIEDFEMTAQSGFYFYRVDVTDNSDWKNHEEDIDNIDAVGLEFVITNNTEGTVTFNAWVDDYTTVGTPTAIPSTAAQIIENFQVPSGRSTITYAQSLGFLRNLPRLRALAGEGKFDYYAQSSANDGSTFLIEKGLVIITISGS